MADYGSNYADESIKRLEKRIKEIYSEAQDDIEKKVTDFWQKSGAKEKVLLQKLKDGEITQKQYNDWVSGQIFQGKQWEAKRMQIIETMNKCDELSVNIINGQMTNVFAANANFMSYYIEHGVGVNFGFGLYDSASVANLLTNYPQILPKWKIDEKKSYIWNYKKVNNAITQGIIQGEKLSQITKRLSEGLSAQNENLMKTFARTGMTQAQNAGRSYQLKEAEKMGINVKKQWMATLDKHTRDSHADLDGESVNNDEPFSNNLMYPGDPHGDPSEVYNCRCTMVADIVDYPSEYERYDNIDGKPIKNMTYKEWAKAKGMPVAPTTPKILEFSQVGIGQAKSVEQINEMLNNTGYFKTKCDLTGCDLDSAKSIASSYEQMFSRFPQLQGKFGGVDAQPTGMKPNTYAWCYIRGANQGKVQVNPTRYNDWRKVVAAYEKDVVSGWHPYGTTAESVVIHELGHAVDGLLAKEGILGGVTASGQFKYASSTLQNTILNRAAKKDDDLFDMLNSYWDKKLGREKAIRSFVSTYATKSNQEWFAECFAEYITSANPRIVASEFGKELEKLLRRLK